MRGIQKFKIEATINKDYRITIPRRARNVFKIKPGDYIKWELFGKGFAIISRAGEKK